MGGVFYIFSEIISARPRKPELIIRENEPLELPPDVVRGTKMCVVAIFVLCQLTKLNICLI